MTAPIEKPKKVPKLRFRGFSDDWVSYKIGDVATKVGSGSTPRGGSAVYKKSGVPFVRSQNVTDGRLDMNNIVYIDQQVHSSMSNSAIKPNDVLLNITGASLGRTCVVPPDFKEGNLSQHVCIVRLIPEVNPTLVSTLLSTPKGLHELLKTQTGGGKEGLNFQAVRAFKITLSEKEEQEKIAEFLNVVDEKILGLQSKKAAMEKYKKVVMQQIFSQKIRFIDKNGKDYHDWQEKKFDDVFSSLPTKIYQIQNKEFRESGHYPVVDQGQDYVAGYTDNVDKVFQQSPVIVFGDHTTFIKYLNFDFVVGADGTKLLKQKGNNVLKYLYYFLEYNKIMPEGYRRHFSVLKLLKIALPPIEEQQKIADFLTSIDNKLNLIEKELDQAKTFKKSLLQQMFV